MSSQSLSTQPGNAPSLGTERLQKNTGWRLYFQTVFARAYPRLVGQQRASELHAVIAS